MVQKSSGEQSTVITATMAHCPPMETNYEDDEEKFIWAGMVSLIRINRTCYFIEMQPTKVERCQKILVKIYYVFLGLIL